MDDATMDGACTGDATRPTIDYGDALRLGVIVPSGNVIAEPQIRAMLPPGVSPLFTRLALRGTTETELLAMMEGAEAAARLLADARVDAIAFHCTAATTFSPTAGAAIRERITAATGIPGLVTSDALRAALDALALRRIVLLSPYTLPTHRREIAFVEQHGVEVVANASLQLETNEDMARLRPEELEAWVCANADQRADGCFVSCTALRTAEIIGSLEARLARPVLTSNQLIVWHALRTAGLAPATSRWGRIMAS